MPMPNIEDEPDWPPLRELASEELAARPKPNGQTIFNVFDQDVRWVDADLCESLRQIGVRASV